MTSTIRKWYHKESREKQNKHSFPLLKFSKVPSKLKEEKRKRKDVETEPGIREMLKTGSRYEMDELSEQKLKREMRKEIVLDMGCSQEEKGDKS